jgi:hypothetical protein
MSNTLNHLKKGESLFNRQLCVIDSALKGSTESSSSFTNTLYQAAERITKIEVADVKLTAGSIYNVNNDNSTLIIDTSLINGEVETENLVVDDTEIQNNQIVATNTPSGSINKYNFISSNDVQITDISSLDTFAYTVGLFGNQLVSFFNTDNLTPVATLLESTDPTAIFCSKYNFDQTIKWRFKITGVDLIYARVEAASSGIYIMGRVSNPSTIKFYNSDDTYNATDLTTGLNASFICKYDFDGNLVWRLKIEQNITTTKNIFMKVNESNSKIYVLVQYAGHTSVFYDKNDTVSFAASTGTGNDVMALGSYSTDGLISGATDYYYYWTSAGSGYVIPTSLTFLGDRLFLAFAFDDDAFSSGALNVLQAGGDVNIAVVQCDISAAMTLTGTIKIGGTATDDDARVEIYDNNGTQNIYIMGNFTSNPVVFYKSDDTQDTVLQNPVAPSVNIFVVQLPITYIESVQSLNYKFYITSTSAISTGDIKINSNGLYLSGNFKTNAQFYDINGYSAGNDITGVTNVGSLFSQFISRYSLAGIFIERFYNNSSGTDIQLDVSSKFLFGINNFTSTEVSDIYTNAASTVDQTLTSKDVNNSVFLSYFQTNDGFLINYTTLDKTIIFRTRQNDEIGFFLNVNTFTETLGFTQSQKYVASNFGTAITWTTLTIAGGVNSALTFNFSIANLTTESFDSFTETISLDIFTEYTPYSLAFELNKAFNAKITTVSYLTQTFDAFVYDAGKNIFYCRIDIQGTFTIVDSALSNTLGINLQLAPYVSQFSVISNVITGDVDDLIIDNTKLTIKLTDNTISEVVNDAAFNAAFPNVSSNELTIGSTLTTSILATTGATADVLTNIATGTEIAFNYPYQRKFLGYTLSLWKKTAMSSTGQYQTAVANKGSIWTSSDFGVTWTIRDVVRQWISVSVSSTGQYQSAVVLPGFIYISIDFGATWSARDSSRNWNDIAISDNGQIITAIVVSGYIYVSINGGISFNRRGTTAQWRSVAMSDDGTKQTAAASVGDIWVSSDSGGTWTQDVSVGGTKAWASVTLSSDGTKQTAVATGDYIWVSTDSGGTWTQDTSVGGTKNWTGVAMSSDATKQTAVATGDYIWTSTDSGGTWTQDTSVGGTKTWKSVAMSSDGTKQTTNSEGGFIWNSTDTGSTWTQNTVVGDSGVYWSNISVSSTGQYQTVVPSSTTPFDIFTSNDYGATWTQDVSVGGTKNWYGIDMSSGGTKQTAVATGDYIWVSTDSGGTWTQDTSVGGIKNWRSVAVSSDGTKQTAAATGDYIWVSTDSGGTWTQDTSVGGIKNWRSVAMSSDATKQTAVATGDYIWTSTDSGGTWTQDTSVGVTKLWTGVAMASDGTIQTAITTTTAWNSTDTGATWTQNALSITGTPTGVSMSSDGRYQVITVNSNIIYESSDFGVTWTARTINSGDLSNISMSSDGSIRAVCTAPGVVHVNLFGNEKLTFNVGALVDNAAAPDQIVFNEIATTANNYALLNNFNMGEGVNFTVKTITTSPAQDLFITPGNYTITEFVAQVNAQIAAVNAGFTQPAFTHDTKNNKITFNPHYTGAEADILVITNLLTSMGFTELPSFILAPVVSNGVVNQNLSGSNNIYILSDTIGNNMKEFTLAVNAKFKHTIASLKLIDGEYKLEFKEEIFLSKKTTFENIDIIMMNDKSELVNLNGGSVSMRMYFTKS